MREEKSSIKNESTQIANKNNESRPILEESSRQTDLL